MSTSRRCLHDLLPDQCAYCQSPPAGLTERVVTTAGGDVFHRTTSCRALREGQRKARQRGQEPHEPATLPLGHVLSERSPCIPCFPDYAPPGTRLCWVWSAGGWRPALLTRWTGRDQAGRWEAWVSVTLEGVQITEKFDQRHLRPRDTGQTRPPEPRATSRSPTTAEAEATETAREWLDVPFEEKDEAKAAGARWDSGARRWYAPRAGIDTLRRWAAGAELPDPLPGEDRTLGSGLFVDLVPSTCWFTNARSCLEPRDWQRIRRLVTTRAGQRCEICSAPPDSQRSRWLEVHERWKYDDSARIQHLRRLICLCAPCHTVTHFGYAMVRGRDAEAMAHLRQVTGMGASAARDHVDAAFATWEHRSRFTWTLDLSILTDAGITAQPAPAAGDRIETARSALEDQE